jgi:hypothetical protein
VRESTAALTFSDHARLNRKDWAMTLIVLDPRSGHQVTVTVPDRPRQQQPVPAAVIRHPKSPS